jgi:hypothetical protein
MRGTELVQEDGFADAKPMPASRRSREPSRDSGKAANRCLGSRGRLSASPVAGASKHPEAGTNARPARITALHPAGLTLFGIGRFSRPAPELAAPEARLSTECLWRTWDERRTQAILRTPAQA